MLTVIKYIIYLFNSKKYSMDLKTRLTEAELKEVIHFIQSKGFYRPLGGEKQPIDNLLDTGDCMTSVCVYYFYSDYGSTVEDDTGAVEHHEELEVDHITRYDEHLCEDLYLPQDQVEIIEETIKLNLQ